MAPFQKRASPKGREAHLTFADAAQQYIARLRECGGKGVRRKDCQLRLHLQPFFEPKVFGKITTSDTRRYQEHRRVQGASEATCNREMAVLSHMFSKGVEWGWLAHRPARISRFKERRGRSVQLTVEQRDRILDAAHRDVSPHIYPYALIAIATSMKTTEILTLRREHVDLMNRRLLDRPISAALAAFLDAHIAALPPGSQWLFPSIASRSGRLATIRRAHRRVVRAAGLDPDVVLRRTLGRPALAADADAVVPGPQRSASAAGEFNLAPLGGRGDDEPNQPCAGNRIALEPLLYRPGADRPRLAKMSIKQGGDLDIASAPAGARPEARRGVEEAIELDVACWSIVVHGANNDHQSGGRQPPLP